MTEQIKSDKELADEIEASMNIMWALAPDREAQREQDRVTGKLMVRYVVAIVKALRRAQSPYVNDGLKKIMSVADEKGVQHDIMGDEFAAMALKDVLAKLNQFEAEANAGKSN